MKLLQLSISYAALWEVDGTYLLFRARGPSSLRAIDKDNAEGIVEGLSRQIAYPQWFNDTFEECNRNATADDAAACNKADSHINFTRIDQQTLKWVCALHKKHKVAHLQWRVLPLEVTGLLHTVLSFNFCGTMRKYLDTKKRYIRAKLLFRPYGTSGVGEEATAYRKHVSQHFVLRTEQEQALCGPRAKSRLQRALVRDRLFNGDWRKTNCIEHDCRGCCSSRDDCCKQIDRFYVTPQLWPRSWAPSRWLGFDEAMIDVGEEINIHGMMLPIYEAAFFNVDFADDAPPGLVEEDKSEHEPEQDEVEEFRELDGDLPEAALEAQAFERQTTYRSNSRRWLRSSPNGRLWALKQLHEVQQDSQKILLRQVGSEWSDTQVLNENHRGEPATYRCLEALVGTYTSPAMAKYAKKCGPEPWLTLPSQHCTHEVSIQAFKGAAASSAGTYELEAKPQSNYPFVPAGLLHKQMVKRLATAQRMDEDFRCKPCAFDSYWYDQVKRNPGGVRVLIGNRFIAKTKATYILSEFEDGSVEAMNAQTRRHVKSKVQCHKIDLTTLSSLTTVQQANKEESSVFGMDEHTVDSKDVGIDGEEEPAKMKGGGGGLWRAFISRFYQQHIDPITHKINFKSLALSYKAEKSDPDITTLSDLKPAAELATESTRAAFRASGGKLRSGDCSGFGVPKVYAVQRQQQAVEDELLIEQFGLRKHTDACAETAIVPFGERHNCMFGKVRVVAGNSLLDQTRVLSRVRKVAAKLASEKAAADLRALRSILHAPPVFGSDLDCQDIATFPVGATLRPHTLGGMRVLHMSDSCCKYASKTVGWMIATRNNLASRLDQAWSEEHRFIPDSELPKIGELPEAAKPTICWRYGYGFCLCSGRGELVHAAKRRLSSLIRRHAPTKTHWLRQDLNTGNIVIRIATEHYHISLMYWRPVRPIVIQMEPDVPDRLWGCDSLRCTYNEKGWLNTLCDFEMLNSMNLEDPLTVQFRKIKVFDARLPDFRPGNRITVCDLEAPLDQPIQFWPGRSEELKEHRKYLEKSRRAAQRRRERRAAGEPAKRRGKRTTHPQRPTRRRRMHDGPTLAILDGAVSEPDAPDAVSDLSSDESDGDCSLGSAGTAYDFGAGEELDMSLAQLKTEVHPAKSPEQDYDFTPGELDELFGEDHDDSGTTNILQNKLRVTSNRVTSVRSNTLGCLNV